MDIIVRADKARLVGIATCAQVGMLGAIVDGIAVRTFGVRVMSARAYIAAITSPIVATIGVIITE